MANSKWEAEYEAHRFDDEDRLAREEQRLEATSGRPEETEQDLVDRAAAVLLVAFGAAFRSDARAITDSVLRTIGNSYSSMCFAYGSEKHPPSIEALRRAMDRYVAAVPAAEPLLFPVEGPFDGWEPKAGPTSKEQFRKLMEEIRAAYWKKRQSQHDGAAFDSITEEDGIPESGRWPLKHTANALVHISAKAQLMNRKYFGGRFS